MTIGVRSLCVLSLLSCLALSAMESHNQLSIQLTNALIYNAIKLRPIYDEKNSIYKYPEIPDDIKKQIEEIPDINAFGWSNLTPLMAAAWIGNLPLVEEVLKQGANINSANEKGEDAIYLALSAQDALCRPVINVPIIKRLLQYPHLDLRRQHRVHWLALSSKSGKIRYIVKEYNSVDRVHNLVEKKIPGAQEISQLFEAHLKKQKDTK